MRARPCSRIHEQAIRDGMSWWCGGCGEWDVVNGRPVRPKAVAR